MKTVNISKKVRAFVVEILLTAVAFFAFMIPSSAAAPTPQAICVPGVTCVTLPPVTVEVPKLVTVKVTLPAATVTVPGAVRTITQTVTKVINGSVTRTVTVPVRVTAPAVQGPVNTVTRTLRETVTIGQNGQPTMGRATVVQDPAPAASTATVTGTPSPNVTRNVETVKQGETVTLTRLKLVGISLAALIIGAALAGLAVLLAYRFGWINGDSGNREFIEETVDDLKNNR